MCVCVCVHVCNCMSAAVESMASLGSIPRVPPRRSLPAWEVKILAAQNIIFNQELFSQVQSLHLSHSLTLPFNRTISLSLLYILCVAD